MKLGLAAKTTKFLEVKNYVLSIVYMGGKTKH